jgi:tetratricopeptide (TPR) repeat protein
VKNKNKKQKQMTDNLELEQDFLSKVQNFWSTYSKKILIGLGAIAVIVGGYYAYSTFVKQPAEMKAQEAMFKAEEYFGMDSCKLALDGDGKSKGFLSIIKNNSGTKAANLAKYYAGVCYLHLGDFNKSVEYLKDFSTSSQPIQMVAYGALADAYSELKKTDDALNYYKKAASTFTVDDQIGGEYLWRAGQLCETVNKSKEALDFYKEVKEKFPKYKQGEIDKYIYKLSIEKNEFSTN